MEVARDQLIAADYVLGSSRNMADMAMPLLSLRIDQCKNVPTDKEVGD